MLIAGYWAVLATVAGAVLAVGGAYTAPGAGGPYPSNGPPALKSLYDYSWMVGLGVGFAVYLVLSLPAFGRPDAPRKQDGLVRPDRIFSR